MREVAALVDRNRKLFFKDKGMLFSSMITPLILIVLYATFLAKVYKDSYTSAFNNMIELSDKMINGGGSSTACRGTYCSELCYSYVLR